jgi:hypothetical protein
MPIVVLFAVSSIALACATPHEATNEPAAKHVKVVRRGIIIDDALVRLPDDASNLVQVLGPPSRTENLANRILTWDELGVYAFVYPDDSRMHTIAFTFECEDLTFCPANAYSGHITVRGTEVPHTLDEQRLREAGFQVEGGWWIRRLGRVKIFLEINLDENGLSQIQITK